MSSNNNFEIEHKYLIRYPEPQVLQCAERVYEIEQVYLNVVNTGVNRRIRKRSTSNGKEFFYTEKQHITDIRRIEIEKLISEEEFNELLLQRDMSRNVISKTRYLIRYREQLFELDVYPFWTDRAVLELEVEDESQVVEIPPEISVICEITCDRRYTNASLAKEIPYDEI